MEFKTLVGIDIVDVLKVFNTSFSDYTVPFQLTLDQLKAKMHADKNALDVSVGVFDQDQLVAFILHGIGPFNGKTTIYNGGTGVIPDKRGNGLTKRMYDFIIPILKAKGVDQLLLEVISSNIPAIKSYKKVGYSIVRTLACFSGQVNVPPQISEFRISEIPAIDWSSWHTEVQPSWQNSNFVLQSDQENQWTLGAFHKNQLIGYIIYTPTNKRIRQLAVHQAYKRRGIATLLIQHIAANYGKTMSCINVDTAHKPLINFFQSIGLNLTLEQYEMSKSFQ